MEDIAKKASDSYNGNGNGNGNGHAQRRELQREIEHQEQLANVEHAQMKADINESKRTHTESIKHVYSKIEDAGKAMDNKHKFVLTIMVSMLAISYGITFDGDSSNKEDLIRINSHLEKRIHEVELQVYTTRDIVMSNDKLLDAIVRGDVLLKSEIEQDGRLLEIIAAMNNKYDKEE